MFEHLYENLGLDTLWESLTYYDPAIYCGIIAAVIVFVIEIKLHNRNLIFSGDEKRLLRAKEKGHVISAKQVKCRYRDRDSGRRNYIATYEYEINGMKVKKVIVSKNQPPLSINMYYDVSPKKVFSDYDVGTSRLLILMYIIPFIAAYFVMRAMGYSG